MPLHPELNLDGLPGPTHGFAGLSYGNLASTSNRATVSNPRAAALQALEKMKLVASLGVPQGILPPLPRPDLTLLRQLGFTGTDQQVLEQVWREDPDLLLSASSASAMWTANAATVCPSADSLDGKVHLTPANLAFQFHRSLETAHTAAHLKTLFNSPLFIHHAPLPSHASLGDEGAANHIRLGMDGPGIQIFVNGPPSGTRFPARHTRRASQSVARLHQVRQVLFLEQSPTAIDAGAFHNDVVSVGSADLLIAHQHSFTTPLPDLQKQLPDITILDVPESELPLNHAIATYLFNSQLVPVGQDLHLIAPTQVRDHPQARATAERLVASGTRLKHVHYLDLTQSMRNGGGPACLRLRVPLKENELADLHPGFLYTPDLHAELTRCIDQHYRTELHPRDLADSNLLMESFDLVLTLARILRTPPVWVDPNQTPRPSQTYRW